MDSQNSRTCWCKLGYTSRPSEDIPTADEKASVQSHSALQDLQASEAFTTGTKDGELPPSRVISGDKLTQVKSFEAIGLDMCGPLWVNQTPKNPKGEKAYVLVVTCLSTRAVSLELTKSLNLDDFLDAMRRTIARRGLMNYVICDNAATLVAGKKEFLPYRYHQMGF